MENIETKSATTIPFGKSFSMSLYGIVASIIVVLIAVPDKGLMPVVLMSVMTTACAGQVILDIRRHPHHRLFKM